MDRRSWLWRRKSSEKSPGETESSGSISSHSERFSDEQVYIILVVIWLSYGFSFFWYRGIYVFDSIFMNFYTTSVISHWVIKRPNSPYLSLLTSPFKRCLGYIAVFSLFFFSLHSQILYLDGQCRYAISDFLQKKKKFFNNLQMSLAFGGPHSSEYRSMPSKS